MNGFRTKRNNNHIALILLYITCYETITPITNTQTFNTYFVHKNPPGLIQYYGQSDINHNVLKVSNLDSKYTEQKIPNHTLFNVRPNYNIIVPKNTSKAEKFVRNITSYRLTSAEAFASNGVPKYVRKTTTIKPLISFVTDLDENEWWPQYFRALEKKNPLQIDKSQRIKRIWEPMRTSNPVLLSKWSRTIIEHPVLKDVAQHQKRPAEGDNERSWTFKPSTYYTMDQEPHTISHVPLNAVKLYAETDKSLLSWREYDLEENIKTRHMIKEKQFHQVPQRTILKSVFIL